MGKRFPSIKLIEKMAEVLEVEAYRLFMDESGLQYGDLDENDDFLMKLPSSILDEMIKRLSAALRGCVKRTFNPAFPGVTEERVFPRRN